MRIRFFMGLLIIVYSISISYALEKLPDDIYIRNLEQGFSYEYLYALKDGRIWIKPNKKNTGKDGEWKLLLKGTQQ